MVGNTARGEFGDIRELSARTRYLQNCIKRGLVPDPLIIRKRPCFKMEYQYFGLGNDYVLALGESIASIPDATVIDLRHNLIKDDGIHLLCKGLSERPNHVKELDLSGNPLREKGSEFLSMYLASKNCVLFTLKLEKCELKRKGGLSLSKGLFKNRSLRHLNVSDNELDGETASAIGVGISPNKFMKSLELSWNNITGYGAGNDNSIITVSFARSIQINDTLTFLDLSYNGFGISPLSSAMQSLANLLTANNHIQHLNLSRNQISYNDMKILERGLRYNYIIKGFHIGGNDGHIDAKGFIHNGRVKNRIKIVG